ncbi:MAG: hypothetical protein QXV17_04680 [Candidatus Micrarchaeaceae archaeon]
MKVLNKQVRDFVSNSVPPITAFLNKRLLVEGYEVDKGVTLTVYTNYQLKEGQVVTFSNPIKVRLFGKAVLSKFDDIKSILDAGDLTEIIPTCVKSKNDRWYLTIMSVKEYQQRKELVSDECVKSV